MAEKQSMVITITLAIVIVCAISALIYVNLPSNNQDELQQEQTSDTEQSNGEDADELLSNLTISLIYGDQELMYNLSALTKFEQNTNSGRHIKTKLLPDSVILGDVYTFTGVTVQTLLEEFDELPKNYTLNVISRDEYVTEYSMDNVLGNVEVYDENGTITNETAVMLLAYMENGSYYHEIDLDNEIGPFRIVFVGDDCPITSSALWSKQVVSIKVNEI